MATQLRLLLKQFRFELVASTIAVGAVFILTLVIHAHVTAILPTKACIDGWLGSEADAIAAGCLNMTEYFSRLEHEAGQLTGAFILLPPILGAIFGTILVSREIEQRTAQFAWSLGSNRLRWLAERVVPIGIFFTVLLVLLAIGAELLESTRWPFIDTRAAFIDYGQRGLPLVAAGLAGFALAILIGAIVGRQLPALILAVIVPVGLLYLTQGLFPFGVVPQMVVVEDSGVGVGSFYATDYIVRQGFLDANGTFTENPPPDFQTNSAIKQVVFEIPGRRLGEVELREGAVLLGIAATGLAGTALVVRRRRPY